MSPILTGVIASGISGNLTPLWSPEGGYDALASVSLSTATASITFSGIPTGYKHLQIRGLSNNTVSSSAFIYAAFNTDTSTNYNWHQLSGDGSAASASNSASFPGAVINNMGLGTNNTAIFGAAIIDILDYTSTTKNKTVRSLSGFDGNGSGVVCINSNLWRNTTAITSITMTYAGGNFAQHSQFALYGVK
jgi:hypothetical protein